MHKISSADCSRWDRATFSYGSSRYVLCGVDANDDEMEDDVPFGKLHQELVAASIQVLKAWFGMMDNPEEEKLEPHMEKLKRMLMRSGEW